MLPKTPDLGAANCVTAWPDLSRWAGRATVRDASVTRPAQGVFSVPLRAADRHFVDKGVYPRHFSRSRSCVLPALEQALRIFTAAMRGASRVKSAGLRPHEILLHAFIRSRSCERLRCSQRACRDVAGEDSGQCERGLQACRTRIRYPS